MRFTCIIRPPPLAKATCCECLRKDTPLCTYRCGRIFLKTLPWDGYLPVFLDIYQYFWIFTIFIYRYLPWFMLKLVDIQSFYHNWLFHLLSRNFEKVSHTLCFFHLPRYLQKYRMFSNHHLKKKNLASCQNTGFSSWSWRLIFWTPYSKWWFFPLSTRVSAGPKLTQDTPVVDIPLLHHDIRMLQQVRHALDSPSSAT